MRKEIARIESTMLGIEDHGIFTFMLTVNYGGSGQGIGGITLDTPQEARTERFRREGTAFGCEMIMQVIKACGVEKWEDIKGRTIYVLQDLEEGASALGTSKVIGIENLPTEPGHQLIFQDLIDEYRDLTDQFKAGPS